MEESRLKGRCLPPNCNIKPETGKLIIKITKIIQTHTAKSLIGKIKLWGESAYSYIEEGVDLCYIVHGSGNMLGQYFRDAGVAKLEFLDSRNNLQVGYALINFLLYLRKTAPYNTVTGPFMEHKTEIFLPILSINKKNIGEVQLAIVCQVDQSTIAHRKMYQRQDPISFNDHLSIKESKAQKLESDSRISNISKVSKKIVKPSGVSFPNQDDQIYISHSNTGKISILSQFNKQREEQSEHNIHQPKSQQRFNFARQLESYQLQKFRLKLETQQLLGTRDLLLTASGNQNKEQFHKQSEIIQIHSFTQLNSTHKHGKKQNSKMNKPSAYIDVFIEEKGLRKHCRIYPTNSSEGIYQSVFTVSINTDIELFLSDQYGKTKFTVNDLSQHSELPVFGSRLNIVGSVKVIRRSLMPSTISPEISKTRKTNQRPDRQQKKIIKKPNAGVINSNNQQKLMKNRDKVQNLDSNSNIQYVKLLIVSIGSAFHPSQLEPVIKIKQNKWKHPYSDKFIYNDCSRYLTIEMRDKNEQNLLGTAQFDTFWDTPLVSLNLRCTLVFDDVIKVRDGVVHLILEIGNIKQINYSINSFHRQQHPKGILQTQHLPPQLDLIRDRTTQDNNNFQKSLQNVYPSKRDVQKQYENTWNIGKEHPQKSQLRESNPSQQQKDKLYTETGRRVQTQPVSDYKMAMGAREQRQQQSESKSKLNYNYDQQIYLLEMLSKGLHGIPVVVMENKVQTQGAPKTKQNFVTLWSQLIPEEESELVEVLADMFCEQGKVQYEQFLKCVKSYHNFVQLWWSFKSEALAKLLAQQPDLQNKIARDSELGIINHSILWQRTLPQITQQIKARINKIYHLSVDNPLLVSEFSEDLRSIKKNQFRIPQQPSSNLISDLGKIIKETIQELITEVPIIQDEFINIKSMCQLLLDLGINVSYWESLMLIEEIKRWYGADLSLSEGVISAATLKEWMKAVIRRIHNTKVSLIEKSAHREIDTNHQPYPLNNPHKISTISNNGHRGTAQNDLNPSIPNKLTTQHVVSSHPSKSNLKSENNNDSDIFNIANLLRENDQINLQTISESKTRNEFGKNKQPYSNILINNSKILEDLQIDKSSSESNNIGQQRTVKSPQPQIKFFRVQIKELKYNKQINQPLKLQVALTGESMHFYWREESDLTGKCFWEKVDVKNMERLTKGLTACITNRNSQSFMAKGILPVDDIIGKVNRPRTIVLYDKPRNIVGKLVVQLTIHDEILKSKEQKSKVELIVDIQKVQPKIQLKMTSSSKTLVQRCELGSFKVLVDADLYNQQLVVEDEDGIVEGVIPLEELFFKEFIGGEYPLLNTLDGRFVGSIKVSITNPTQNKLNVQIHTSLANQEQTPIEYIENSNTSNLHSLESTLAKKNIPKTECKGQFQAIFLDQLITFSKQSNKTTKELTGSVYIKKSVRASSQVVFKSETIYHKFATFSNLSVTKLNNQVYQNHQREVDGQIIVEFAAEGKVIATGNLSELSESGFLVLEFNPKLTSTSQRNYALRLKIRVLRVPETEYSTKRILQGLSQPQISTLSVPYQAQSEKVLNEVKELNKLTYTQVSLIEKIININGKRNVLSMMHPLSFDQEFIDEILYHDDSLSGFIGKDKLEEILKLCKVEYGQLQKQKEEGIDVVTLVYRMSMAQPSNSNAKFAGKSAFDQINQLHREITKKYG